MPLQLEIVTPERQVYSDEVDSVQLPGSEGELGVLPHHAPLVSTLGVGELRFRKGGVEESFAIVGGFLQVRPDRVVVLAETADMASEIDLEKARRPAARPGAPWSPGTTKAPTWPRPGRSPAGAPSDPRRRTTPSRGSPPPRLGSWLTLGRSTGNTSPSP